MLIKAQKNRRFILTYLYTSI